MESAVFGRGFQRRSVLQVPRRTARKSALALLSVGLVSAALLYWLRPAGDVPIPNVIGMPFDNAVAALAAVQLVPERQERLSDTAVPGIILAQIPAAGTRQARTTRVILKVSAQSPAPPPAPPVVSPKPQPSPNVPTVSKRERDKPQSPKRPKTTVSNDVAKNDVNPSGTVLPDPGRAGQAVAKQAMDISKDEEELQQRLELMKRRVEVLSGFFDRRRKSVESSGGHLRPEIETTLQEISLDVPTATQLLQAHQITEAKRYVDMLQETLQRLEAMK